MRHHHYCIAGPKTIGSFVSYIDTLLFFRILNSVVTVNMNPLMRKVVACHSSAYLEFTLECTVQPHLLDHVHIPV